MYFFFLICFSFLFPNLKNEDVWSRMSSDRRLVAHCAGCLFVDSFFFFFLFSFSGGFFFSLSGVFFYSFLSPFAYEFLKGIQWRHCSDAASWLGLYCLHMSLKCVSGLKRVRSSRVHRIITAISMLVQLFVPVKLSFTDCQSSWHPSRFAYRKCNQKYSMHLNKCII